VKKGDEENEGERGQEESGIVSDECTKQDPRTQKKQRGGGRTEGSFRGFRTQPNRRENPETQIKFKTIIVLSGFITKLRPPSRWTGRMEKKRWGGDVSANDPSPIYL